MSKPVTVLDYGIGNLLNVCRALEAMGATVTLASHAQAGLEDASRIVLPGVGAFGDGMAEMKQRGLDDVVRRFVQSQRPFLGICVGMQMLFEAGEEMGEHMGLGLLGGRVVPVPAAGLDGQPHHVPHIGWRELRTARSWDGSILRDLKPGMRVYFVHSYAAVPTDRAVTLAEVDYDGISICAAVQKDNLLGCQFHPERSAAGGLRILRRFLTLMSNSPATIATICARGGSKDLPGKNLRELQGLPLIVHSIRQALACKAVSGVYVSTDDPAIAEVVRAAGARVPFLRPADLATDQAPKLPALEHLVAWLEADGVAVGTVVDLQPTSPLRERHDIDDALAADPGAGLIVSVCEARDNPYFNLVERAPDGRVALSKGRGSARRQDVPDVFALNGSIYVWQRRALQAAAQDGLWSVPRIGLYLMPRSRSVDIDDLEDFEYAQWLLGRRKGSAQ